MLVQKWWEEKRSAAWDEVGFYAVFECKCKRTCVVCEVTPLGAGAMPSGC